MSACSGISFSGARFSSVISNTSMSSKGKARSNSKSEYLVIDTEEKNEVSTTSQTPIEVLGMEESDNMPVVTSVEPSESDQASEQVSILKQAFILLSMLLTVTSAGAVAVIPTLYYILDFMGIVSEIEPDHIVGDYDQLSRGMYVIPGIAGTGIFLGLILCIIDQNEKINAIRHRLNTRPSMPMEEEPDFLNKTFIYELTSEPVNRLYPIFSGRYYQFSKDDEGHIFIKPFNNIMSEEDWHTFEIGSTGDSSPGGIYRLSKIFNRNDNAKTYTETILGELMLKRYPSVKPSPPMPKHAKFDRSHYLWLNIKLSKEGEDSKKLQRDYFFTFDFDFNFQLKGSQLAESNVDLNIQILKKFEEIALKNNKKFSLRTLLVDLQLYIHVAMGKERDDSAMCEQLPSDGVTPESFREAFKVLEDTRQKQINFTICPFFAVLYAASQQQQIILIDLIKSKNNMDKTGETSKHYIIPENIDLYLFKPKYTKDDVTYDRSKLSYENGFFDNSYLFIMKAGSRYFYPLSEISQPELFPCFPCLPLNPLEFAEEYPYFKGRGHDKSGNIS